MSADIIARGLAVKGVKQAALANERINQLPNGYIAKGSVDTYNELPLTGNQIGDSYTVQQADADHKAGRYAWGYSHGVLQWYYSDGDNDYATQTELDDGLAEKADKVKGAVSGNFAGLDAKGNIIDSGSKASDFDPAGTANTAVEAHNNNNDAHSTLFAGKQNVTDSNLSTSSKTIVGAINELDTDLNTHTSDTNNPHQVTKSQVGLGSVDNTSDLDKPISTAVQNALNAKQNTIDNSHKLSADLVDDTGTTNKFVTTSEKSTWNAKQNALTFDNAPIQGSNNPVTSNGIYQAIQSAGGASFNGIFDVEETSPEYDATLALSIVDAEHVDNFSITEIGIMSYITNPTSGYLEVPANRDGYMGIANLVDNPYFDIETHPTCSFDEFATYDAVVFNLFVNGGVSSDIIKVYYYNNAFKILDKGSWQEVYMPLAIYNETQHAEVIPQNLNDMFYLIRTGKIVLLADNGSTIGDFKFGLSDVRLVKDKVDISLGDKFVHIDKNNFSILNQTGGIENALIDGQKVIKITSTNTWANLMIKPGKTYQELLNSDYTALKIRLYIDGNNDIQFYNQGKYNGSTTNDFVSYTNIKTEEPYTDPDLKPLTVFATANQWTDLYIPMSRIKQMWAGLKLGTNALMIDRGKAFDALYISEITCI